MSNGGINNGDALANDGEGSVELIGEPLAQVAVADLIAYVSGKDVMPAIIGMINRQRELPIPNPVKEWIVNYYASIQEISTPIESIASTPEVTDADELPPDAEPELQP